MRKVHNKKTQKDAIKDLIRCYGSLYDYSNVIYQGAHSKIKLVCQEHGEFSTSFTNLISKKSGKYPGCPVCSLIQRGLNRRLPKQDFIEKAITVHGDRYDYNLDSYSTKDKKMEIICKSHGVFLQSPEKHLAGRNCPKCTGHFRVDSLEFLTRAYNVHGNKYDYTITDLKSIDDGGVESFIHIKCKDHGIFKQRVASHLNGVGCRACAKYGFNSSKPAYFYVLISDCNNVIKIGITNRDISIRLKEINKFSPYVFEILDVFKFEFGKNALDLETKILNLFDRNMDRVEHVFSGSTECYYINEYNYGHTILEELEKLEGLYE